MCQNLTFRCVKCDAWTLAHTVNGAPICDDCAAYEADDERKRALEDPECPS